MMRCLIKRNTLFSKIKSQQICNPILQAGSQIVVVSEFHSGQVYLHVCVMFDRGMCYFWCVDVMLVMEEEEEGDDFLGCRGAFGAQGSIKVRWDTGKMNLA